jgi:DNA-binding response OmpR family regulator
MIKPKVLIVDDEPDIVESIRFRLEAEDIECIEAYDGEEALAKARNELPDLILLDIMMPKMNGYKVSRLLKFDAAFEEVPLIMLTARGQAKDIKIGEETGADEYITKPFDMEAMVESVKKHLKRRFDNK